MRNLERFSRAGSHPRFGRYWGVASLTRDNSPSEASPESFGPFRVLHQIGVGVLGPVFRTYEPSHDRLVAVKAFRLDITPEQARDLADELTRLAELQLFHPSIVAPIAAGVEGTVAFLAQEYVAAESLDIALRHYAPAPMAKVSPFITQLAGAIDFASTSGVSHGTLHPRDVFVTPDEARATGFGVAAALATVGVRAPVRRPYSAPERIAGEEWSTSADVFSLAAIACELLTGRRITGTGAQAVSGVAAGSARLAPALQEILARALDEDPARRPQRALEFAAALESATATATPVAGGTSEPSLFDAEDSVPATTTRSDTEDAEPPGGELDDAHEILHVVSEPELGADAFDRNRALEEEPLDELDFQETSDAVHAATMTPADLFDPDSFDRGDGVDFDVTPHDTRDAIAADDHPLPVEEHRSRPAMLPYAAVLIVGVFAGFIAGYGLGSREQAAKSSVALTTSSPASEKTKPVGTEWSEAAVAEAPPPTAPPAGTDVALPPPDAPPPRADTRPSATTQPAAATSTGRIVVRTKPAGARVTVNGRRRGVSPLEIDRIPFGTYTIQVARSGYQTASRRVAVSAANPEGRAVFGLRRANAEPVPASSRSESTFTGTITVDSRPRGARVLLDGRFIGTTPLTLSGVRAGSHTVRLEREGFTRWSSTVRVVGGQRARIAASLERDRTQ